MLIGESALKIMLYRLSADELLPRCEFSFDFPFKNFSLFWPLLVGTHS